MQQMPPGWHKCVVRSPEPYVLEQASELLLELDKPGLHYVQGRTHLMRTHEDLLRSKPCRCLLGQAEAGWAVAVSSSGLLHRWPVPVQ